MTKFSKLTTLAIAGIVSLALTSGVFAEEAKKEAAQAKATTKATAKPAAKAKTHWVRGKVTAVDAAAGTITIEKKEKKGTESLTFTAGKNIKLDDIKKDSTVTVAYTKEGDKMEASSVKAHVTKMASAKKSTTHTHAAKKEEKKEEKSESSESK